MNYRVLGLVFLFSWVGGCASADRHSVADLSDGSSVHTLHCEDSWTGCYQSAQEICGSRGFEEVDRVVDGKVTSAGHLARLHSIDGGTDDHVYSEAPRNEVFDRTVTVRCKQN